MLDILVFFCLFVFVSMMALIRKRSNHRLKCMGRVLKGFKCNFNFTAYTLQYNGTKWCSACSAHSAKKITFEKVLLSRNHDTR